MEAFVPQRETSRERARLATARAKRTRGVAPRKHSPGKGQQATAPVKRKQTKQ